MRGQPVPEPREVLEQAVELVSGDRAALLVRQPLLGLLALRLELVALDDEELASVATDGVHLMVPARRWLGLDPTRRRYWIAHLVWHCALLHPWRRGGRDPKLWDLAIDHEVNTLLAPDFDLPRDSVWFEPWSGESADQVCARLARQSALPERSPDSDLHLDLGRELPRSRGVHPGTRLGVVAPAQPERWREHLSAALATVVRRGLELPPEVLRIAQRLGGPPCLPWQGLLGQFVASAFGERRQWLPPNRRFLHRGLYLPRRRHELLELVVVLDTSQSTRAWQGRLLGELGAIVQAYQHYLILLLQGDHRLRRVEVFSDDHPLDCSRLELVGFGGTDFRPVFEYLARQPEPPRGLVFLTDGHGRAPAQPPPYPVLWVLTTDGQPPASWGRVLKLPAPDQMAG